MKIRTVIGITSTCSHMFGKNGANMLCSRILAGKQKVRARNCAFKKVFLTRSISLFRWHNTSTESLETPPPCCTDISFMDIARNAI